jgi:outer membrane receptor protein involved in Fe transport
MNPFFFVVLILTAFQPATAAESKTTLTDLRLDTITVNADSSFDSLSEESYVPTKKIIFEQTRTNTIDSINKSEVFPSANYGYPAGAIGVNLAGRSIEDTQVFTLGVPLNLPQGGGADLSFFPSYLWSNAIISPTISSAGFSPQAASGSVQLTPWTREAVRQNDSKNASSRATFGYDRNLQTYSLGTRVENLAILAGMSLGLQKGPAAELSYYFLRERNHHLLVHFLGTSQDGSSPGSKSFPTPNNRKKTWRVIPVIESHQQLDSNLTIENTFYADLQELQIVSPTALYDTRTQQYGLENAILFRNYTIALSARYIHYVNAPQSNHEWPLLASLTGEYAVSSQGTLRLTAGGNYLETAGGFYPLARATYKQQVDTEQFWFAETNTAPKLPTLVARFYPNDGSFVGNPSLKTERVSALLVGHDFANRTFENTLTLKSEFRDDIQVITSSTTINLGNAYLLSAKDDVKVKVSQYLELNASALVTWSRLKNNDEPYPNLPYYSQLLGLKISKGDLGNFNFLARYTGKSRNPQFGGTTVDHPDFFLYDTWVSYQLNANLTFTAGIDNLFDSHAEVVMDYPLPGRVAYLSAQARF